MCELNIVCKRIRHYTNLFRPPAFYIQVQRPVSRVTGFFVQVDSGIMKPNEKPTPTIMTRRKLRLQKEALV